MRKNQLKRIITWRYGKIIDYCFRKIIPTYEINKSEFVLFSGIFSGQQMHKPTRDLISQNQLYRKSRKILLFRYKVILWCIENHEEHPVFDTISRFCIENLIKVSLVDTTLKFVVSKTHINQAFSIHIQVRRRSV